MLTKMRKGTFETNSSSVHSIVIDVGSSPAPRSDIEFLCDGGEYGWGYDCLASPSELASYLWQAVCCLCESEYYDKDEAVTFWTDAIHEWLPNAEIEYVGNRNGYDRYIDHASELIDLLEQFKDDDILLGCYLVNSGSFVEIYNDNEDDFRDEFSYPEGNYIFYEKGN